MAILVSIIYRNEDGSRSRVLICHGYDGKRLRHEVPDEGYGTPSLTPGWKQRDSYPICPEHALPTDTPYDG